MKIELRFSLYKMLNYLECKNTYNKQHWRCLVGGDCRGKVNLTPIRDVKNLGIQQSSKENRFYSNCLLSTSWRQEGLS